MEGQKNEEPSEESESVLIKIPCRFCSQAIKNEQFLESIEEGHPHDFHDWKVTIIFYIAVHYLTSYANTQGVNLAKHSDTFEKLYGQDGEQPELAIHQEARADYSKLFKLSRTTRYDGYIDVKGRAKLDKLRLRDAKQMLERFKSHIIPELEKANIDIAA